MGQSFHTTRRVEFRDTDAAGIAHFSVFFVYMEQAEHELLRHLGLSVMFHDDQGRISFPRVGARCDYQRAVKFEDVVDIEVSIVQAGHQERHLRVQLHARRAGGGQWPDDDGLLPA